MLMLAVAYIRYHPRGGPARPAVAAVPVARAAVARGGSCVVVALAVARGGSAVPL